MMVGRYSDDPEYDMQYEPTLEHKADLAMLIIMFKHECIFRCKYCFFHTLYRHDPNIKLEMVLNAIQAGNRFRSDIDKDISAVLFSGAECTLFEELPEVFRAVKDAGLKVILHTNGTNPNMLEYLVDNRLVDVVALDVKATPEKYELVTGRAIDVGLIKRSIEIVKKLENYKFRITVSKGLLSKDDVCKIADLIGSGEYVEIKGYYSKVASRDSDGLSEYSSQDLKDMATAIMHQFGKVTVLEGRRGLGGA